MKQWARELNLPQKFTTVIENIPNGLRGSEYVKFGYDWYETHHGTSEARNRALNGRIFEGLVLGALQIEGIVPAYYQAKVTFIPNTVYDILLYHPRRPVILSCKVSLRERWKQADLEGAALKQVYRGAKSILLTLSHKEGVRVQRQIENHEVMGLDACIVIQSKGDYFDRLIQELKCTQFLEASPIIPVDGRIMNTL